MRKIANTDELQSELRRLLAYSQGEQPSRARIASELQTLSMQLAPPRTAAHVSESEEFYKLMDAEWNSAQYDEKKGTGTVRAGVLGLVEWRESSNDSAVIVEVKKPLYMKARAQAAADALEQIAKALDIGV